ncbi:MAG: hypothetical protein PHY45_05040 [Rhodocyclaceae bacterium]|nr:hypothetical protein [Rhodocyclaceae bacterium]
MNSIKSALVLIAAAIGMFGGTAWADHGHGFAHEGGHAHGDWHGSWHGHGEWHRHWGGAIYFGPTFGWPPYATPFDDPYAMSPLATTPEPPPIYIERGDSGSPPEVAPSPTRYWYYCEAAAAYYPYVKDCPGGWTRVLPQPPTPP